MKKSFSHTALSLLVIGGAVVMEEKPATAGPIYPPNFLVVANTDATGADSGNNGSSGDYTADNGLQNYFGGSLTNRWSVVVSPTSDPSTDVNALAESSTLSFDSGIGGYPFDTTAFLVVGSGFMDPDSAQVWIGESYSLVGLSGLVDGDVTANVTLGAPGSGGGSDNFVLQLTDPDLPFDFAVPVTVTNNLTAAGETIGFNDFPGATDITLWAQATDGETPAQALSDVSMQIGENTPEPNTGGYAFMALLALRALARRRPKIG